jgi:hypothetical protein
MDASQWGKWAWVCRARGMRLVGKLVWHGSDVLNAAITALENRWPYFDESRVDDMISGVVLWQMRTVRSFGYDGYQGRHERGEA